MERRHTTSSAKESRYGSSTSSFFPLTVDVKDEHEVEEWEEWRGR